MVNDWFIMIYISHASMRFIPVNEYYIAKLSESGWRITLLIMVVADIDQ